MDTASDKPAEETWDDIPEDIKALTTEEILTRIRLIDNDIKVGILSLAVLHRLTSSRSCVQRHSGYNTSKVS